MSQELEELTTQETSTKWYKEGLSFECTECGKCCSGAPGYVWVNQNEIRAIASNLDMAIDEFRRRYLRYVEGRWSLKERHVGSEEKYDCVFLKDNKCTIYETRPVQCKTYPWWPENLSTEGDWAELRFECEGVNPEASVVEITTIEKQKNALNEARSQL